MKVGYYKDGMELITIEAPPNIKGFLKFSRDWEYEIILRMCLLPLHNLFKIEPEETLWSAYSNTWHHSESLAPSRPRYVQECKSPLHELAAIIFSLITIPKTQHLQKCTCVYVFILCGGIGIGRKKTTDYRWKIKWRRFGFCSQRLHIWHLNIARSDSQMDQIQWNFFENGAVVLFI